MEKRGSSGLSTTSLFTKATPWNAGPAKIKAMTEKQTRLRNATLGETSLGTQFHWVHDKATNGFERFEFRPPEGPVPVLIVSKAYIIVLRGYNQRACIGKPAKANLTRESHAQPSSGSFCSHQVNEASNKTRLLEKCTCG